MSICKYCGKEAGFLKRKHKECLKLFNEGKDNIILSLDAFIKNDEELNNFQNKINIISENSYVSNSDKEKILFEGILKEINRILNKKINEINQLQKIISIISNYNLKTKLIENSYYKNFVIFLSDFFANEIVNIFYIKKVSEIENEITDLRNKLDLDDEFINNNIIKSFEKAIYNSLEDGVISDEEEVSIAEFRNHFSLSHEDLSNNEAYLKLVKSLVIKDILNGKIPKRAEITDQTFFNLQKNENLIWLINDVDYYEDRVKRQYVGGSHGASIRIAKGFYYRVGGFRGEPIDTVQKIYFGKGILGFTNKHLYFFNYETTFRIRYDKIISVTPSSDGFTILKDGVTAKPQTFVDGDGWFSYNMITNLSQIELK